MERKRLSAVWIAVWFLLGTVSAAFAGPIRGDEGSGGKPAKIKLPKTLYCVMTTVRERYSINLRPITNEMGDPTETLEVQLFRNDHLVTPLGKIGGGQKLEEFILFTLPPADAGAFNSTAASRGQQNGVDERSAGMDTGSSWGSGNWGSENAMSGKTGRNFQLRVFDAAGQLLAKKKVLLVLN